MSEALRSYRRNVVHVRQALELLEREAGRMQVDGGYLQDEGVRERYKRLSIPVRRALNGSDRASFVQAIAAIGPDGAAGDLRVRAEVAWQKLQQELSSTVVLGGEKVARRQILLGWLDAAAFYDQLDRDRAYDQLVDRLGKAAEGMGAQLMEDAARVLSTARRSRRRRARRARHPAAADEDAPAATRSQRVVVETTIWGRWRQRRRL